jgi:hypothetical protein
MNIISMRGQRVDMAKLAATNSHKVAIGNANMNARGDKISPHGVVLATREQYMNDYNASNPRAVRQVGLNGIRNEIMMSPSEVVAQARKQMTEVKAEQHKRKIADTEV